MQKARTLHSLSPLTIIHFCNAFPSSFSPASVTCLPLRITSTNGLPGSSRSRATVPPSFLTNSTALASASSARAGPYEHMITHDITPHGNSFYMIASKFREPDLSEMNVTENNKLTVRAGSVI